jgi:hypothetical protein
MTLKFETVFRGFLLFFLILALGGIWAVAQTAEKAPEAPNSTNSPSLLARHLDQLEGHYLTFGLDRIKLLTENRLFGEPLWKYVASLIYILLAFYVSKTND